MKSKWLLLIMGIIVALALPTEANALRSTKHESYTDPAYVNYRPHKILVVVDKADNRGRRALQKKIKEKFARFGVTAIGYRELFPPTRNWTAQEREAIYNQYGIDSVLVVTYGASASSVFRIATQTYGTTRVTGNVYGNSFSGTARSNSTSYDIYGVKSKADFSAILISTSTGETAWYVDITSKAGGALFVGDKRNGKAAAKEIVKALKEDGHLNKSDGSNYNKNSQSSKNKRSSVSSNAGYATRIDHGLEAIRVETETGSFFSQDKSDQRIEAFLISKGFTREEIRRILEAISP